MRHRRSAVTVFFTLFASLGAGVALAQEQTGSIEGTLRDSQGGRVRGAVITVRDSAGLTVEFTTRNDGGYFFPALPPGRYDLTAQLTGFTPVRVESVDLRLGQALTIDLTLEPATLSETVSVTAESPLISITSSAVTTSYRGDEIEKLPTGRDFSSVVGLVAGVNDEPRLGGISVDGSSGAENRFVVDGAEFSDMAQGVAYHRIVTDFVDELQVKSSGYSAEYGGSTGGVINVVTRSGSNRWQGNGLVYWSSHGLDADPRPSLRLNPVDNSVAEFVVYPKDEYTQLEPGFTLGGPILRDRLWFFAGYIPEFRPVDRTVRFLANDREQTYQQDRRIDRATANLTAQLGSRWRFRVGATHSRWNERGRLPKRDGTDDPDGDYSIDSFEPMYTVSGSVDYLASSRAYVSLRGGYFHDNAWNEGVHEGDIVYYLRSSIGIPGVPPEYQQPRGYRNVPTNYNVDHYRWKRLNLQLDTTLFLSGGGQHQIKTGFQLDRRRLDILHGNTGNRHLMLWGQSFAGESGEFGYYMVDSNGLFPNKGFVTAGDAAVNNLGLFVQDRWTIGHRLTLNLGLRTENEHVPSLSDKPEFAGDAIHWRFGDKLAPRLGFAWDVLGDGRAKLYGAWGVFYDIMKLSLPVGLFGGQHWLRYWYALDSADLSQILDNPACPPDCPGDLLLGPIDFRYPANDTIASDIRPMKLQEAAVGFDYELGGNLVLGLRYVHKQVDRAVEDVGTLDAQQNEVYLIGNPGFGDASSFVPAGGTTPMEFPSARRDYDAVEIGLDKRMANGWFGRVAYTWSRLEGNYSGLSQSDEDGRVSPNVGRNFDYPLMSFDERGEPVYGPLGTDRTHQIKAQVLWDTTFGTSLGASWFGASGIPRTREAAFVPGHWYPVMYLGRGSDGRMPFLSRLDLYVQHQFRLGERARLTLSANVMNLFDQATPINYFQYELFDGEAISVSETEFYQGIDTQALIEEQGVLRDARFLLDKDYQEPRTIRLGVRVSF